MIIVCLVNEVRRHHCFKLNRPRGVQTGSVLDLSQLQDQYSGSVFSTTTLPETAHLHASSLEKKACCETAYLCASSFVTKPLVYK